MGQTKVEKLMAVIEEECVFIEYVDFPDMIQGLYYKAENCPPVIGISETIVSDKKLFTAVLAEEVGHYFTTVGDTTAEYYSYRGRLVLNKQEILALKWATEFLLPVDEIIQGVKEKHLDFNGLSDFLEVPSEFLLERLKFLAKKKDYIEIDHNTYLMLNNLPNLNIIKNYYADDLANSDVLMVAEY